MCAEFRRGRNGVLWGGLNLNSEPDVPILLNGAREQLGSAEFNKVFFTIEKYRLGLTNVESRHRLNGKYLPSINRKGASPISPPIIQAALL